MPCAYKRGCAALAAECRRDDSRSRSRPAIVAISRPLAACIITIHPSGGGIVGQGSTAPAAASAPYASAASATYRQHRRRMLLRCLRSRPARQSDGVGIILIGSLQWALHYRTGGGGGGGGGLSQRCCHISPRY